MALFSKYREAEESRRWEERAAERRKADEEFDAMVRQRIDGESNLDYDIRIARHEHGGNSMAGPVRYQIETNVLLRHILAALEKR